MKQPLPTSHQKSKRDIFKLLGKSDTGRCRRLKPTRTSLLKRLKNLDDSRSWMEFFDLYWQVIYGCARRAGLRDAEAQDIVQETFISVAKKMPDFEYDRKKASFRSWLRNLTQWKVIDHLRKRGREQARTVCADESKTRTRALERIPDPRGNRLDAIWDGEWQKSLLAAALARVKRKANLKQYQIFDLYVVKQWPVEKIAASLDVSAGQVYLSKHRISLLLQKEIEQLEDQYH